ncbi:MAG: methyl-accepting chemotaxis protein, partial [Candidatus Eremiobacteraeota bacterium]|nr:methyl-accepting chemotaxis protein [Candidatus Eremiobacteraeota bacterium]
SETDLLALNAAIEAAHAGDDGRAFSVIASEIRLLALSTTDSARNVARLLAGVRDGGQSLRVTFAGAAEQTASVDEGAHAVRTAIGALRSDLDDAVQRGFGVTATAEEQSRALERILDGAARSTVAVEESAGAAGDERREALMDLVSRTYAVAERRPIGLAVERIRPFVMRLADRVESAIERAAATARIPLDRLFAYRYDELRGARIRELSRLFDVARVPAEGFTPAKYATPYDVHLDVAVADVLDEELARSAEFQPLTIAIADLNSFLWCYPRHFMANWTGDAEIDKRVNRVKRFNEERFALATARFALGDGSSVPLRAPYEAFARAGCTLARPAGERPWRARVYPRDTSVVYNELAVPLYVAGRRHSTLRFSYADSVI